MLTLILVLVCTSVVTAFAIHFLTRHHIVSAMAEKKLALVCSFCAATVARFEQMANTLIRCENCKNKQEREQSRQ